MNSLRTLGLALLLASGLCPQELCAQKRRRAPRSEPFFHTTFGRQYIGQSAGIVIAEISAVERIGATSKLVLHLSAIDWIHGGTAHGERQRSTLRVIGEYASDHGIGQRVLLFLRRPSGTRQYWVTGLVRSNERSFAKKRELVERYLSIAFMPAEERFPALVAYLEATLRDAASGSWARWHALRELSELTLEYPRRIEVKHLDRWKRWARRSKAMLAALGKLERDWLRLRAGK